MESNQNQSRRITFFDRYYSEDTWYGKVIIIEIYHLARTRTHKDWTISKTAEDFGLSIGLVSENLKIAEAMHKDSSIINCKNRLDALRKVGG